MLCYVLRPSSSSRNSVQFNSLKKQISRPLDLFFPPPHKSLRATQVELFEGPRPSSLEGHTSYASNFAKREVHPRPPRTANIDMARSEREWALTDKNAPGSFTTSGKMPSHGAMVYQRHPELPIRTMSNVQITHDPEGPGALRDVQTMYRTTNSVYDDAGNGSGVRGKLLAGDNFNTRCNWDRTKSKVKIGGGSAEALPAGTVSASHATNTLRDYPQEFYYVAANGYGRHPPPWHTPSVDLSHDPHGVVIGGKGNGGLDYKIPQRPYADVGVTIPGGEGFATHNQKAYANPGKEAIAHAFVPREHVRGRGEWRMPHDDGTMDLDRIGAAALRLASSADTMNAGFQKTTAAMAAAERVAMGPSDMPRRHMWDRTAATVPMKGGDGADDETVRVPHSRRTYTGAQPAPEETMGMRLGRGTVNRFESKVMMKSPAAGTKNVMEIPKSRDDFTAANYAVPAKQTLPVRNTSSVPMKQKAGEGFHREVSDYHNTFKKPTMKDYRRRVDTVGLGTMSRVSLAHDAQTIF